MFLICGLCPERENKTKDKNRNRIRIHSLGVGGLQFAFRNTTWFSSLRIFHLHNSSFSCSWTVSMNCFEEHHPTEHILMVLKQRRVTIIVDVCRVMYTRAQHVFRKWISLINVINHWYKEKRSLMPNTPLTQTTWATAGESRTNKLLYYFDRVSRSRITEGSVQNTYECHHR